ncbi:hypothetical protein CTAYLR_004554 [Chrysophaeum taylorii]|uniref:Uncharacterized protein n=1 Tax=Chrysophaeum taylorii TaxID=2483200 RepID=A0AAD7UFW3_9STRA|nr:hypothetical protein CTAYLR_004554 [Chrysophaeum taylorii]
MFWIVLWSIPAKAFVPVSKSPAPSKVALTPEDVDPMMAARSRAFIWFFGASGGAGIARSAFPGMFRNVVRIQQLGEGGDYWLPLYPRRVPRADLERIVLTDVEQCVRDYPVENNYMASRGFLTYDAFQRANDADGLAIRAVFDCFAQGANTATPEIAQTKLDRYRVDLNELRWDLLRSKLTGWAAIFTLLFLLGYADIEAYTNIYAGWFPDWPGGRLWLEGGLWDPDVGITHIPEYWVD